MTMPWTYILLCSDNTLYTGAAKDLSQRIAKHQAGKGAKYTRGRRPVSLAWAEEHQTMSGALKREARIKKMPRWKKKRLVDGTKRDAPGGPGASCH